MKYEWNKQEKTLYSTKTIPQIINIPIQSFIMIRGEGNPNREDFAMRVSALYSLAYTIKMQYKAQPQNTSQYDDFTVFPLEGVWTTSNPDQPLNKEFFLYTIMIRQPDFITREFFEMALAIAKKKKTNPLLDEIVLDSMEEGMCVQVLHVGPFDDEPQSFARMDSLVQEQGLQRRYFHHREIYMSDPRKTEQQKAKTILRYQVK